MQQGSCCWIFSPPSKLKHCRGSSWPWEINMGGLALLRGSPIEATSPPNPQLKGIPPLLRRETGTRAVNRGAWTRISWYQDIFIKTNDLICRNSPRDTPRRCFEGITRKRASGREKGGKKSGGGWLVVGGGGGMSLAPAQSESEVRRPVWLPTNWTTLRHSSMLNLLTSACKTLRVWQTGSGSAGEELSLEGRQRTAGRHKPQLFG